MCRNVPGLGEGRVREWGWKGPEIMAGCSWHGISDPSPLGHSPQVSLNLHPLDNGCRTEKTNRAAQVRVGSFTSDNLMVLPSLLGRSSRNFGTAVALALGKKIGLGVREVILWLISFP